ncbi:MAG: DUF3237 family protein [Rhodococcus sp. (in: high G+C Gram-positive bacteria)]
MTRHLRCNEGIRVASVEDTAALAAGTVVPASRVYFMTAPVFSTTSTSLGWLNDRRFVGRGQRFPDSVEIDIFAVQ